LHVAVPLVWSFKLLMLMLTGSETDQVAKAKGNGGGMQPFGKTGLARNCCWFPGAAAVWLATALWGAMLSAVELQLRALLPPQPAAAKHNSKPMTVFAGVVSIGKTG
jgi:hypothetical protein